MNTIGQNIAFFRKRKNMTQEELAEKMSVTAQAVSKWECDTSYPDITVLQRLSKVLGVNSAAILDGEERLVEIKEAPQEVIDRRVAVFEVRTNGTTVLARFPVPAIQKAIENGTLERRVGEDDFEEISCILGMIDSGLVGRLVDVETKGAHILITVEAYED